MYTTATITTMCKVSIQEIILISLVFTVAAGQLSDTVHTEVENLLCDSKFCKDFNKKNSCPPLPKRCSVQNATVNGVFLPSLGPCNCCQFCLDNLNIEEDCTVGSVTGLVPTNLCGPMLTCSSTTKQCSTITDTKCAKELADYEQRYQEGKLGNREEKPNCDDDGNYAPFKCVPGEICYCIDEEGNRIFGEIPYTNLASHVLKCECSRHNNRASKLLDFQVNSWTAMRCTSDGNFDKIQCLENDCFCVDPISGIPLNPNETPVKIEDISSETLSCYNDSVHSTDEFYKECEESFTADYVEDHITFAEDDIVMYGYIYPRCQMDGNFDYVQQNLTHKFCADKNGDVWNDYTVHIDSLEAKNMDCKCSRVEQVINQLEMPQCCPNGNYNKMQCRRGECRCVDNNGNQIEKEVVDLLKDTLTCFKNQC